MVYRATRQFTDRKGKAYKQGEPFEGTQKEIDEQLATGNIEQVLPPPAGGGGERGGAPA